MKKVLQRWIAQYFGTEEAVLLSVFLVASIIIVATLGDVLGPVIAALIFAFLLQGVVNNLTKQGVSKNCCRTLNLLTLFSNIHHCFGCFNTDYWQTNIITFKRVAQYGRAA